METRVMTKRLGLAACVLAVVLLGLALVSGRIAHSASLDGAQISEAVVRLAAVPGRPAAGYAMLVGGPTDDRLLGVTAPAPIRIEMHETRTQGGRTAMVPLAALAVPAGARVMFAPGGKHLMLFGVPASIAAGGTLRLGFHFEKAGLVTVAAIVRSAGDAAPAHQH